MKGIFDNIVVRDIVSVQTITAPRGRHSYIKDRASYGLSLCTDGQMRYYMEGKVTISDPDCIVVLPMKKSYELVCDRTGVFPLINFTCEGLLCDSHISIPIKDTDSLLKDFEQLRQLSISPASKLRAMSVFYSMLDQIVRDGVFSSVSPAIKYISENYASPELSNETLAEVCGISEVYLRRLFSSEIGTSPHKYLIDVRMSHAKQYLSEGSLSIGEISELCGFSSSYHFCRAFKSAVGMTPSEYMKKNRITKI